MEQGRWEEVFEKFLIKLQLPGGFPTTEFGTWGLSLDWSGSDISIWPKLDRLKHKNRISNKLEKSVFICNWFKIEM